MFSRVLRLAPRANVMGRRALLSAGAVGAIGGMALGLQNSASAAGDTLYDKVAALAKAVEALESKAGGGSAAYDLKMRIVQFEIGGAVHCGIELDNEVVDLTAAGLAANTLTLARMGTPGLIAATEVVNGGKFRVSKPVKLKAPIDGVQKLICIGMNYVEHCTEQNMPIPTEPVVFNKFPNVICGPGDPLIKDPETNELDYEVELAIVIGETVPRRTSVADADQYILGYTVVHDVSARDWQLKRNGGQWLIGKTFDNYAPIGPAIVTKASIDPNNIGLRCRVNGRTLQDGHTSQFVFTPQVVVSWISKFVTLVPGDVICTGTPSGVGCFRKPQIWLKSGDVVECEIDGIGTLTNPVV